MVIRLSVPQWNLCVRALQYYELRFNRDITNIVYSIDDRMRNSSTHPIAIRFTDSHFITLTHALLAYADFISKEPVKSDPTGLIRSVLSKFSSSIKEALDVVWDITF